MFALPFHSQCTDPHNLPAGQQDAVPLLLQRGPTAFDWIVFAVIRRIVEQVDFQTRPVRKLDHSFEKLCSRTRVLRTIIQVDRQTLHFGKTVFHAQPPRTQTVAPEVARLMASEDQSQRAGQQNQNSERHQFVFGRRIMIPAFGDFAFAVGPCFFPPKRIRLN